MHLGRVGGRGAALSCRDPDPQVTMPVCGHHPAGRSVVLGPSKSETRAAQPRCVSWGLETRAEETAEGDETAGTPGGPTIWTWAQAGAGRS